MYFVMQKGFPERNNFINLQCCIFPLFFLFKCIKFIFSRGIINALGLRGLVISVVHGSVQLVHYAKWAHPLKSFVFFPLVWTQRQFPLSYSQGCEMDVGLQHSSLLLSHNAEFTTSFPRVAIFFFYELEQKLYCLFGRLSGWLKKCISRHFFIMINTIIGKLNWRNNSNQWKNRFVQVMQ